MAGITKTSNPKNQVDPAHLERVWQAHALRMNGANQAQIAEVMKCGRSYVTRLLREAYQAHREARSTDGMDDLQEFLDQEDHIVKMCMDRVEKLSPDNRTAPALLAVASAARERQAKAKGLFIQLNAQVDSHGNDIDVQKMMLDANKNMNKEGQGPTGDKLKLIKGAS